MSTKSTRALSIPLSGILTMELPDHLPIYIIYIYKSYMTIFSHSNLNFREKIFYKIIIEFSLNNLYQSVNMDNLEYILI